MNSILLIVSYRVDVINSFLHFTRKQHSQHRSATRCCDVGLRIGIKATI